MSPDIEALLEDMEKLACFLVNRSPVASGEELGHAKVCDKATETIRDLAGDKWNPVYTPPEDSTPVTCYHPDWVDADFNPLGLREGFCNDGDRWVTAKWIDYQDCYEATENDTPLLWHPLPAPPEDIQMSNSDEELLAGMPKTGLIERHACVEWIKGRCTECDTHYTHYIDQLHAALQEQQKIIDIAASLNNKLQAKVYVLQSRISILESEATHKDTELIKAVAAKRECAIAQMENPIIRFTLSEINQVLTALRDRETYTTEPTVNTGGKGQVLIDGLENELGLARGTIESHCQTILGQRDIIINQKAKIEQFEQALESAKKMLQLQPMGSYDDQCWINGVAVSIDAELERIRKL